MVFNRLLLLLLLHTKRSPFIVSTNPFNFDKVSSVTPGSLWRSDSASHIFGVFGWGSCCEIASEFHHTQLGYDNLQKNQIVVLPTNIFRRPFIKRRKTSLSVWLILRKRIKHHAIKLYKFFIFTKYFLWKIVQTKFDLSLFEIFGKHKVHSMWMLGIIRFLWLYTRYTMYIFQTDTNFVFYTVYTTLSEWKSLEKPKMHLQ